MDFLRQCASQLDDGVAAKDVLEAMRERYTTPACMKVKTCLVRSMCKPDPAFAEALNAQLTAIHDGADRTRLRESVERAIARGARRTGDLAVDSILRALPPLLSRNARDLHVSGGEMRECKRVARCARLCKNRLKTAVDGRALLEAARASIRAGSTLGELALSLMLITGRRQCEILSGASTFDPVPGIARAAAFTGQAKRRTSDATYRIPLLDDYAVVEAGYAKLRGLQKHETMTRREASRRYQSLLSRRLASGNDAFAEAQHPHGLRGIYACMALCAFRWAPKSDSFVTMCILGHRDLEESLVYTTYDVGDEFRVQFSDAFDDAVAEFYNENGDERHA